MPEATDFNNNWESDDHPIVNVMWKDARAFCEWAGGRLPTEAEWKYEARGGKEGLKYSNGDELTEKDAHFGSEGTFPVGQFPPNGYGLLDVAGNVWEWSSDWYDENHYRSSPENDPSGPQTGQYRVVRSGSWGSPPRGLRVSGRLRDEPDSENYLLRFRCAREVFP